MHGVVKANGRASWIWRGRPEDHPLAVAKRRRDRERELQRQRAVFENLVLIVGRILDRGEPTRFRFEATCRYSLRVHFIWQGRSWALSDFMAETVTREALHRLGVKRPRFIEGQKEYAELPGEAPSERYYCDRCGKLLPEGRHLFCSRICSQAESNDRQRHEFVQMTAVEREIAKQVRQQMRKEHFAAARTITCAWCGAPHTPPPMSNPRTFCSRSCASSARWAARRAEQPPRLAATP